MERLVTKTILVKYMTVASLLTVITGVVLYGINSGFTLDWIVSREGQIFTIGSLVGLITHATGQFVISPTSQRIGALGHEMARAF
jgi:hypothetical protein